MPLVCPLRCAALQDLELKEVKDGELVVTRSLEVPSGWDTSKAKGVRLGAGRGPSAGMAWRVPPASTGDGRLGRLYCDSLPCAPRWHVPPSPTQDFDHVALLAQETVQEGHSVLVFCGTKQQCENSARLISRWVDASAEGTCAAALHLLCNCVKRLPACPPARPSTSADS